MVQREVEGKTSREVMEGVKAHQIALAEVVVHRTDGTAPRSPGFAERPSAERLPEDIEFGERREERRAGIRPQVERLPEELPERGQGPSAERLPEDIEFEGRAEVRGESRRPEAERLPEDLQKAAPAEGAREPAREELGEYIVEGEARKKEGKKKKGGGREEWSPY